MATIPSISLIPSGYKAGKVYSVLPTDGSGDLTFARASTATRINKNNLIENVGNNVPRLDYEDGGCPSLLLEPTSRNLITQSESFGNSYWTKSGATIEGDASTAGAEKVVNGDFATDSDWTITNGGGGATSVIGSGYLRLVTDGTSTQAVQDIGMVVGKTYKLTYEILSTDGGYLAIIESNNTAKLIPSTIGTHTVYYQPNDQNFTFKRYSGALDVQIDNVSVKEILGFSAPSVDSPLGAFKLVESSANESHYLGRITTGLTTGGTYTTSIICKAGEINWLLYIDWSSTANSVYLDISNKAVGTKGATMGDVKFEDLADGFVRVSLTYPLDAAQSQTHNRWYLATGNGASTTYTGDGTSGVYLFGAQLEQKSYATSYIKTSGSQITRLAETANGAGNASTFNDSEGVLMVETKFLENGRIGISNSDNSDQVLFGNSNGIFYRITENNANPITQFIEVSQFENHKIALKYKSTETSIFIDGFELNTNSTSYSLSGLNELAFVAQDSPFYGKTKQIQYYNTALTALEIETLTSYTSFNAMALAQNYTI